MAEFKQYITQVQDNGNVMISEDVVAAIVNHAVAEVEGVAGLSSKVAADLIGKSWGKGMKIIISEDNTLTIDCNVVIEYGQSVIDVAKNVQQSITNAVESMTGVQVSMVNVNICGIARQ